MKRFQDVQPKTSTNNKLMKASRNLAATAAAEAEKPKDEELVVPEWLWFNHENFSKKDLSDIFVI